jgi:hypothetical protein
MNCVAEKAELPFQKLCANDGVLSTKDFRTYLVLRSKYLAAKAESDAWLVQNPGSSQLPLQIYTKIKNAENAWMVAGKRGRYDDYIEKVRRNSVACGQ